MVRPGICSLALLAVACGGVADRDAGAPGTTALTPGRVMTLYRDAAVVWDRRWMEIPAGRSRLVMAPGLPARASGAPALISLSDPEGLRVLSADTAGAAELAWTVESARGGEQLVEASYVVEGVSWMANYLLEIEDRGPRAALSGYLIIANGTETPLVADTVRIADADLPASAGALRPDHHAADGSHPALLSRALSMAPGTVMSTPPPGLRGSKRAVAAALRLLYEPVGPELVNAASRPIVAARYGPRAGAPERPVRRGVEIDLARSGWARELLAGTTLIQRRARGKPSPLAMMRAFSPAQIQGARMFLDVGEAPLVRGRRWQSDFFHDGLARRVVEEIRITLESRDSEPMTVVVRERLYRGLNWTVAYHNGVGHPRKEGAQAIRFEVELPPGETATIMYRVVYTW